MAQSAGARLGAHRRQEKGGWRWAASRGAETSEQTEHPRALHVARLLGQAMSLRPGLLLARFCPRSGRSALPPSDGSLHSSPDTAPLDSAGLSQMASVLHRCFAVQESFPATGALLSWPRRPAWVRNAALRPTRLRIPRRGRREAPFPNAGRCEHSAGRGVGGRVAGC